MSAARSASRSRLAIPRWRFAVYALVTALATAATTTAVAELVARRFVGTRFAPGLSPIGRPVQAIAVRDPEIGWVNDPGIRTRVIAPRFEHVVTHDANGRRGRYVPFEKPAGVRRVAVLGDSIAWGWGVDDEQTFVAIVDEALGADVELVNLAVPGHSTDQQLWLLERDGVRYAPDLVLLVFVLNDVVGNRSVAFMDRAKPVYRRAPDGSWKLTGRPVERVAGDAPARTPWSARVGTWLYGHSALLQAARPPDAKVELAARRDEPAPRPLTDVERARHERMVVEERRRADEVVRAESPTHHLLGALAERCRALGVPLVACAVPHHHDLYLFSRAFPRPAGLERHAEPDAPPFETYLTARLREAGAELGFDVFSVDQALLEGVLAGGSIDVGDGHLNAYGNRLVAERVAAELSARLASPD